MKKASLAICCFYAPMILSLAQSNVAELAERIKSSRMSAEAIKISDPTVGRQVLSAIGLLINDSSQNARFTGYAFLGHYNNKEIAPTLREQAVEMLFAGCRDVSLGLRGHICDILVRFAKKDFSQRARDTLAALLKTVPAYYNNIVKLCGYLGMTDQREMIASHLQANRLNKRDAWAARLALCRLGDQNVLDQLVRRARQVPLTDDAIVAVYPDLIYTRQPKAIEYLVEQILSNKAQCEAPNPELQQTIPCSIHIIRLLAPALVDFPLEFDSNGDFAVHDHSIILSRTQEWLKQGKYKIRTDNF